MCEKIFLARIAAKDYIPYIQQAAQIKWSINLVEEVIAKILALSELHPFYVNYLCSKLWFNNNYPQTVKDVEEGWHDCLLAEERRLLEELDKLTLNQLLTKGYCTYTKLKRTYSY